MELQQAFKAAASELTLQPADLRGQCGRTARRYSTVESGEASGASRKGGIAARNRERGVRHGGRAVARWRCRIPFALYTPSNAMVIGPSGFGAQQASSSTTAMQNWQTRSAFVVKGRPEGGEIRQFHVSPVITAALPWYPRQRTTASRRKRGRRWQSTTAVPDTAGRRRQEWKNMRGVDAQHIPLPRPPQRLLDLAHPIDAVGRQRSGTARRPRSRARSSTPPGVAWWQTPSDAGTCAAASRAGSSVQLFGR